MAEMNFPSNSEKSKKATPRPVIQPVVPEGAVVERKKPLGSRIAETFAGDSGKEVGQFVLFDVLLPSVKSMIYEAITQGLQRRLFGNGSPSSSGGYSILSNGGRTAYNKVFSMSRSTPVVPQETQQTRVVPADDKVDIHQIVLNDRGKAELVLDSLRALISEYDFAKKTDLLQLLGITGNFTDENWGWADLSTARVRPLSPHEYLLVLPPEVPVN